MVVKTLSLEAFREMDHLAVQKYALPIELMMENAGLQLARLVARSASKGSKITIGAGNGNNGGGGLVAARRLAAWGFDVYLHTPVEINKALPSKQLERSLLFGAKREAPAKTDIWVDAYLGFSQRLPLSEVFLKAIGKANAAPAFKISLDIPTGISDDGERPMFSADQVLTLAAPKTILNTLPIRTEVYFVDIGIPSPVYKKFDIPMPQFYEHQIIKILRN